MQERQRRRAVIVDIDGTIALMGKGEPGRRGPYDWHRVGEDDPNQPIIDLVSLFRRNGYQIVFVSGRNEVCRNQTEMWLSATSAAHPDDPLFMRPSSEPTRPDQEIKLELYKRHVEPFYDVRYVLDDRAKVVAAWRSLGLTVLQCAPGDF